MADFEKYSKHWVWALLAFIITTLIAVATMYLQYKSTQHDIGGNLNAKYHTRLLNNKDARTIIVCVDDTTVELEGLYVTPTFDNQSEFSLKDFSLSFDAECTNVTPVPTSFVDIHEYGKNEWIYKYKDNILAAYDDTKKIFQSFKINDKRGRCYIKTKASYDGAASAFEYETDVWFIVEPNLRNLSFEDWKINCKKRIFEIVNEKYYDVYYFSKKHEPEFQFDVSLSADNKTKTINDKKSDNTLSDISNISTIPQRQVEAVENNNLHENVEDDDKFEGYIAKNDIEIADYHLIVKKEKYAELKIVCNEILAASEDYLLLYDYKDSLNEINHSFHYYRGLGRKEFTLNLGGVYGVEKLRLRKKINYSEAIEEIREGNKIKLKNKTESVLVYVLPYSDYSITYGIVNPLQTLSIDNNTAVPIILFELEKKPSLFPAEKNESIIQIGSGFVLGISIAWGILGLIILFSFIYFKFFDKN